MQCWSILLDVYAFVVYKLPTRALRFWHREPRVPPMLFWKDYPGLGAVLLRRVPDFPDIKP